jgi:putative ABC transport system permease protein
MIQSYKQITGRYLKVNKKRSILTVIGIVLSVALISSIGLFFKGIQIAQIQEYKDRYGSFHLVFRNINEDLYTKITNNPKVSKYGLYSVGPETQLSDKLTVGEILATDQALEFLPYKAKEGRLPQNETEAAVEQWALKKIDSKASVGSKISFGNKEYTLVGILENVIENQMENKAVILTKNQNISKDKALLLVEISSKTNIDKALIELKQLVPKEDVQENIYLLSVMGVGEGGSALIGLFAVVGVIIAIVVISTIAVIYNSFQISVVERIKQFGLLRAIGTTPKQIRKIILREAGVLAVIGVPIGLLFGVVAIYGIGFTFKLIGGESVLPMKASMDIGVLAISAAVGLVSIYLSALMPAFFAGRTSPLVAISSRNAITKEKIKKRKNMLVQKLFGFEGAMAAKNIKRSRKRYRITVFSIVISVVLFIVFKSFLDMSLTVTSGMNESKDMHFSVIRDYDSTEKNATIEDKIIKDLKGLNSVKEVYKIYETYDFGAGINKGREVKEVQNIGGIYGNANVDGVDKTFISTSIVTYDAPALEVAKKYLQSGSLSVEELNKENGVILINKNRIRNIKTKKDYFGPVANLKVGDEIYLQYNPPLEGDVEPIEFGRGKLKKAKVLAILEDDPFNYRGNQSGLKLISTDEVAKNLTGIEKVEPVNLNIAIKDIKQEETARTEIEAVLKQNPSLSIINNIDSNRREKTTILMVKILVYGFVIVVSLIGSVNIVNTITTNIILRKREFSALKSIGMTQKGLRKMILLEGILYGIVGTVYGSIVGCGLSYVIFRGMNDVRELSWPIPWDSMAVAGTAALIIGYLSVLAPLSRIKKENLIEVIREE